MSTEEYLKEKQLIIDEQNKLNIKLANLKLRHIRENAPFNIGDTVKQRVRNPLDEFGIVYGFEVSYRGEVITKCYKIKKDGTPSKYNLYIPDDSSLELCI